MRTRTYLAALATATAMSFALPAFAADKAQEFVNKAAIGGMFEVESSKAAEAKLQNQPVKDFAQKMIGDHGSANAKLKAIAVEQKLTVPAELDAEHKAALEQIQSATGNVDVVYVEAQRKAHADAVALFDSYAADGDNTALKSFAQETAPTLKMHHDMVEQIAASDTGAASSTTPAVSTTDTANPAAPVPGANSFTEGQATTRIQEAGYSDVSGLAKDDQGIWRGKAMKDGTSVDVALDFEGNVVAGAK